MELFVWQAWAMHDLQNCKEKFTQGTQFPSSLLHIYIILYCTVYNSTKQNSEYLLAVESLRY
jgi:hypothetical protein